MKLVEISTHFGDGREAYVSYCNETKHYHVLMVDYDNNLRKERVYGHRTLAEDAAEDWCL